MNYCSVDRINREQGFAVLERDDRSTVEVPLYKLPEDLRPGNVLRVYPDGSMELDPDEEAMRRKRILKLQNDLFQTET